MSKEDKNTNKPNKPGEEFNWNRVFKIVLGWSAILIGFFLIMVYTKGSDAQSSQISFNEFQTLIRENKVKSATVRKSNNNYEFDGTLVSPQNFQVAGRTITTDKINVFLPYTNLSNDVIAEWEKAGINFTIEKDEGSWFEPLIGILPWILIIAFWIFIMRRMSQNAGGGTRGIFSFGKAKPKMLSESSVKVTFKDVAGADEAKQELSEIIEFLKTPQKFQKLGGKIPKGVLLLGPPGTGKTLLARAVAGEAGVPFFSISGADFVEMFVGVGASRVRDLFEQGKKSAPCIIFIDEIDKIAGGDVKGGAGPDVSRQGVQRDLLPIVEGSTVMTKYGGVRTDHILFVASGAFHMSKPSDLIPELQGRFPIRVELDSLGKDEFYKILTQPKNALIKQYKALLASENVTLEFEEDAINEIAKIAAEVNEKVENIGARRLHTILTTLLEDIMFDIPDRSKVKHIKISKNLVTKKLSVITKDRDLSRYIL